MHVRGRGPSRLSYSHILIFSPSLSLSTWSPFRSQDQGRSPNAHPINCPPQPDTHSELREDFPYLNATSAYRDARYVA
jgi:hypothetical protein